MTSTWSTLSDLTTGTKITAAIWNSILGASGNLQYLYDRNQQSICRVTEATYSWHYTLGPNSGTNNTWVDLEFDTVTSDPDGIRTSATTFTIPFAGVWLFQVRLYRTFASNDFLSLYDGTKYLGYNYVYAESRYGLTYAGYFDASAVIKVQQYLSSHSGGAIYVGPTANSDYGVTVMNLTPPV